MEVPFSELPFDLSEELERWKRENGTEKTSKMGATFFQIDYRSGERRRLFIVLLTKLQSLGAEKYHFKIGPARNEIIKESIGLKHVMGNKKYANATVCAANDLNSAILAVFGSDSDYYKNNGKVRKSILEKSDVEREADAERDKHEAIREATPEPVSRELEPCADMPDEPPKPKKMWKDVQKELIASGRLVEEPIHYEEDPEIKKIFGTEDE